MTSSPHKHKNIFNAIHEYLEFDFIDFTFICCALTLFASISIERWKIYISAVTVQATGLPQFDIFINIYLCTM